MECQRALGELQGSLGLSFLEQVSRQKRESARIGGIQLQGALGAAHAFESILARFVVPPELLQRLGREERALEILAPHRGGLAGHVAHYLFGWTEDERIFWAS